MSELTIGNGLGGREIRLVDDIVPDFASVDLPAVITDVAGMVPENVAGGKFDPFTEIEMERLGNKDGFQSNYFNIRVKESTSDNKYMEAGAVSENYLLVTNQQVHDICHEIRNESGLGWSPVKTYFDGKKYRNVWNTTEAGTDLAVGDTVNLMLTEMNSYDGSQQAGFRIDFMVLSCLNGMITNKYGWGYSFRHNRQNVKWENEIRQGALQIAGNMQSDRIDQFARACNQLQQPLGKSGLARVTAKHIDKLPPLRYGQITRQYEIDLHEGKHNGSAWDYMQTGTSSLWHRDKMTNADFKNNAYFVDGLLEFGAKLGAEA
mgnify:FL=1